MEHRTVKFNHHIARFKEAAQVTAGRLRHDGAQWQTTGAAALLLSGLPKEHDGTTCRLEPRGHICYDVNRKTR
ncbi:hypothetical protein EVAR_98345_1 [Eumeta japonica]|uniref:Uncharacterized protein n=1 Tax=Eumeta variegata TaxID=151549 RepID=A0A4C1X9J4_EUMVA|nr:hypothetical protein EVAR_98345_1 [Eumeta japonica]